MGAEGESWRKGQNLDQSNPASVRYYCRMKLVMRPGLEMDDVVVIAIFRVGSHFIEEILRWFLPIHLLLLWKIVPIYAFDDAAVEATVAEVPAIPTFHPQLCKVRTTLGVIHTVNPSLTGKSRVL